MFKGLGFPLQGGYRDLIGFPLEGLEGIIEIP